MRRYVPVFAFVAAFAIFLLAAGLMLRGGIGDEGAQAQLGAVLYGTGQADRWDNLQQGINQACLELDIESPVILTAAGDSGAQERLLRQELAGGAGGLLIAPEDSAATAALLDGAGLGVPVVLLKGGIEGMEYTGADDEGMARLLAESLRHVPGAVTLLAPDSARDNLLVRQEAFLAAMAAQGRAVTAVAWTGALPEAGVIVALDTQTLLEAAALEGDVPLYGIGSHISLVHALDKGSLWGLVYQNEYAIGYLATMRLADAMGLAPAQPDAAVQYMYVDRDSMFQRDAERLLFPISE